MDKEQARGERLIRNSFLNILNSLIAVAVSSVTSIIVARVLGPASYGIYNLVLWLTGIISWVIGMGLVDAVTKYVAEYRGRNDEAAVGGIVRFVLKIEIILTVAVTAVLVFFRTPIADYFFSPNEGFFFLLAFLGLLPGMVTAVFASTIEGLQKFEYFTYFQIVSAPLSFACKMAAFYLGYRLDGLLVVTLFFSFVNTFYYFFVLRREKVSLSPFAPGLRREIRRRIHGFNLTLSGIMVSNKVIWDKSENFFLGRFCSSEQTGYYNLAYNVTRRFMSILPETFWKVLLPAMSGYFGAGHQDKIKRIFYLSSRYLAFVSFPVGVAGMVLAYPMIRFLYGTEFIGAKYALQIFFFSNIFTSLCQPGSAILYGMEKQGFILKYGMCLAVINLVLDILFIPRYGALGAAVICSTVTMAGALGGLFYTCRVAGLAYPFKSISKIVFSAIIMGICMKITVSQKAEFIGFILSLPVGCFVYLICTAVLGSFEEEDYILMNRVRSALPGGAGRLAGTFIGFLSSFKEK